MFVWVDTHILCMDGAVYAVCMCIVLLAQRGQGQCAADPLHRPAASPMQDRIEDWRPTVKNMTLILSLVVVTLSLNYVCLSPPPLHHMPQAWVCCLSACSCL